MRNSFVVLLADVVLSALSHQEAALDSVDLDHPVLLLLAGVDVEVLARDCLDDEAVGVVGVVFQSR